ncbi:MAG TPA: metallophosphoesterase [Rhizomicrobium sp.]|nr:metallophosphoesterase [Rhizomicrobium sp.]
MSFLRSRLLYGLLFPTAVIFLVYAGWIEPASLRLSFYAVPVSAPALNGLRIAVISDLHAGAPYIDSAKIDQVVAMTNAARPDLILLTGDYVITGVLGGRHMPIRAIAQHLKALHAPLGVYAVQGNHDRGESAEAIARAFQRVDIPDLENAHVRLPPPRDQITLVGIGDYASHGADPDSALGGVSAPALCFTHSPDIFPLLPRACSLTVAGHTHGGQVVVPLLGRPALYEASRYGQKYALGVIREDGKILFVATGIGTSWLPLRFGVPPEISVLTLE